MDELLSGVIFWALIARTGGQETLPVSPAETDVPGKFPKGRGHRGESPRTRAHRVSVGREEGARVGSWAFRKFPETGGSVWG